MNGFVGKTKKRIDVGLCTLMSVAFTLSAKAELDLPVPEIDMSKDVAANNLDIDLSNLYMGINYVVQSSADLKNWDDVESVTVVPDENGKFTVENLSMDGPRKFYKVSYSVPVPGAAIAPAAEPVAAKAAAEPVVVEEEPKPARVKNKKRKHRHPHLKK